MPSRYLDVSGKYESMNPLDCLDELNHPYDSRATAFRRTDSFDNANFSDSGFRQTNLATEYGSSQRGFDGNFNPYSFGQAMDTDMSMSGSMFNLNTFIPPHHEAQSSSLPTLSSVEPDQAEESSPRSPMTSKLEDSCDETPEPLLVEPEETQTPEPLDPPPKRKRGRPRREVSEISYKPCAKVRSQRIPHNKVERKYRDGLNGQLEHLRLNVPTLPIYNPDSPIGPPKPGKMAVLAAAVDYIKSLEAETKRLTDENEELRSPGGNGLRSSAGTGSRRRRKEG